MIVVDRVALRRVDVASVVIVGVVLDDAGLVLAQFSQHLLNHRGLARPRSAANPNDDRSHSPLIGPIEYWLKGRPLLA